MFSYNFGIYMMVAVVLLFESSLLASSRIFRVLHACVSIILKVEGKKLQPVRVRATIRLLSLLLYFSTLVEEFCYSM